MDRVWSDQREQLIALLAAIENPQKCALLPGDDVGLVTVARHHRLSPLVSATCSQSLRPSLLEAFRRDRVVTLARSMILREVAEECVRALVAAGVRTTVLKGLAYEAYLYDVAGVRPTADVDLLVPNGDRRRAFAVLDRLGFEPRAAAPGFDDSDYHEVAWHRTGVEIDLHLGLAPFARCKIDYAAIWNEVRPLRLGETTACALAPRHAAIFQALHMAIDHFDVPAIYLVDFARLVPNGDDLLAAQAVANSWRCGRPFATAAYLTATFLPGWSRSLHVAPPPGRLSRRVAERYGSTSSLPRAEQLFRKLVHFDAPLDAVRYVAVQSRRNLRELYERRVRRRSARERLSLVK